MTEPSIDFLNRWSHEFLGKCWHVGKKGGLKATKPYFFKCPLCGEEGRYYKFVEKKPNYCGNRDLSAKIIRQMWLLQDETLKDRFITHIKIGIVEELESHDCLHTFGDGEEWYDEMLILDCNPDIMVRAAHKTMGEK